jgi:hypothetical protein
MLHKNRRAPTMPDTGSKPAWETSGRQTGEQISVTWYSHGHPWINQHSPLDRLIPCPANKKKLNKNKKLKSNMQQRGQGALSAPEKWEEQGAALHTNFQ